MNATSALPHVFPTVVHMLAEAAARSPAAVALVCGERSLTYAQYLRCVASFAHDLIRHGAGREARVAIVGRNSLDMPIAMFAVHAAGAQAVPINPAYTTRELTYILADAAPTAIVYDADVAGTVEPLIASHAIPYAVRLGEGGRDLDRWAVDPVQELPPFPAPDDLATLQYTGGTTGLPKGVNITHRQMTVNISQREAALPTRADDERILCLMPLFHVFAVAMCLHLSAYCRGKLVIMPRFHPHEALDLITRERITRLPAGPTVFIGLLSDEKFATIDFSSLRTSYSGSAPLPEETLRRWQQCTGSPILEGFGQTEAGPVLTYVPEGGELKVGSCGPALPLTEIEIVDVGTGTKVLGVGEIGEIRARGPQIMSGYRNKPAETSEALRDGWLYTGDIGELDADGYIYIRDRKKDMAIVGGYNVYPREVDEVLFSHPDVKEAASAGVLDSYYGEVIRAYVVLKPGGRTAPEDLVAHCKANLARYKVPSRIFIVDALPRTSVGKIDRVTLRQQLAVEQTG